VERYLAALREGVTPADWAVIIGKAVEQAKAGDRAAREWLSRYLLSAAAIRLPAVEPPSVRAAAQQADGRGEIAFTAEDVERLVAAWQASAEDSPVG